MNTNQTTPEKWIAYLRVSTEDKGQTTIQQLSDIEAHAAIEGAEIVATFEDMESGAHTDRPGLRKAIARAKEQGATLIVSRADRLSRNLPHALKVIFHSGIKVLALDLGRENMKDEFIVTVIWSLAAKERSNTRIRVKAKMNKIGEALEQANKAYYEGMSVEDCVINFPLAANIIQSGKYEAGAWRFGNPNASTTSTQTAAHAKRVKIANTNENSTDTAAEVKRYLSNGGKRSYGAIADHLKAEGFLTPRGTTKHTRQSVKNLCTRFGIEI